MGIGDALSLGGRIARYEQASIVGIVFTILGSTMGWLVVEADASAAAESDDLREGTNTFTGMDLGFGDITFFLALVAGVVLAIVLWRYRSAGRKTGLVVMLVGLITFGVALVGILLTGVIFAPADELEGVSVDLGGGILLTLLGSVVMLSGGVLRLAAGAPDVPPADESGDVGDGGAADHVPSAEGGASPEEAAAAGAAEPEAADDADE